MKYYEEQGVIVRDAEVSDVFKLAKNMRRQERDEIWAEAHLGPEEALFTSYRRSAFAYSVFFGDELIAMFGVVPESLVSDRGIVWMLTGDGVQKIWIRFLRASRHFVEFLRTKYPMLYNFVDVRHERAIAWLRWIGADIFPPEAHGIDKMPFCYFTFGGR